MQPFRPSVRLNMYQLGYRNPSPRVSRQPPDRRRWSMYWRTTLSAAVVFGAVVLAAPLAAQTAAIPASAPALETADTSWPVVVPRLATFTVEQKASINTMLQQHCTPDMSPSRSELQDRIRTILTPDQEIAA